MSKSEHALPQQGGSYIRQPDGALKRNKEEAAPAAKPDGKQARDATKEK